MSDFFCLDNSIWIEDARIIETRIEEENEVRPHMIHVHADEIIENIRIHGGLVARVSSTWELAGMVKLVMIQQTTPIYEWGSLFVMPRFRGMKLGWLLIREVVSRYHLRALAMVTNVPSVIAVSSRDKNQILLENTSMNPRFRQIVEWPQPLLPDDHVFINHTTSNLIASWDF